MPNIINLNSAELVAVLKASLPITKNVDSSTPVLKGVHLSTSTDSLLVTATDRYTLVRMAIPNTTGDALTPEDIGVVDEDDVKNLLKLLPTRSTTVVVSVEEEDILSIYVVGGARLDITLRPEQYPLSAVHLLRKDGITNAPHFEKDAEVREGSSPIIELDTSKAATIYKVFELLGWQSVRTAFPATRRSGAGSFVYFVGGRENSKIRRSSGRPLTAMAVVMGMSPCKNDQDEDPELPYAELSI